jgi:hypothetical protein
MLFSSGKSSAASSTMSRNIDQEIADMRQEIQDLEKAIARQDRRWLRTPGP